LAQYSRAIGYQNLRTFDGRFGLPTNFDARRWRILTKVLAKMKSLNPENDLRLFFYLKKIVNRFLKMKETFTVKLKIIFVDHHFELHQTLKNTKYFSKNILHPNTDHYI